MHRGYYIGAVNLTQPLNYLPNQAAIRLLHFSSQALNLFPVQVLCHFLLWCCFAVTASRAGFKHSKSHWKRQKKVSYLTLLYIGLQLTLKELKSLLLTLFLPKSWLFPPEKTAKITKGEVPKLSLILTSLLFLVLSGAQPIQSCQLNCPNLQLKVNQMGQYIHVSEGHYV